LVNVCVDRAKLNLLASSISVFSGITQFFNNFSVCLSGRYKVERNDLCLWSAGSSWHYLGKVHCSRLQVKVHGHRWKTQTQNIFDKMRPEFETVNKLVEFFFVLKWSVRPQVGLFQFHKNFLIDIICSSSVRPSYLNNIYSIDKF